MADTALALQKALNAALAGMTAPSAATGASAVTVGLVDHPAENAPWPLVILESHETSSEGDAYEADATETEHTVEIAVWTQYRGSRQAQTILGQMYDRLHGVKLVLEAGQCLSCRVTRQLTNREPDGRTYQGTMTLTIITADEDL